MLLRFQRPCIGLVAHGDYDHDMKTVQRSDEEPLVNQPPTPHHAMHYDGALAVRGVLNGESDNWPRR